MSFVCIIPARGGSKRIKNKNIKFMAGKPLIAWTIEAAKKAKVIDDIYVTSENKKILKISKKLNIKTINRPRALSNDKIHVDDAVLHCYRTIKKRYDYIVLLQPTSPLRNHKHISEAIKLIKRTKADCLVSVVKKKILLWTKKNKFIEPVSYKIFKRPRSQDMKLFSENGAIYITKSKIFLQNKNRLGGKIIAYEMKDKYSIDIDSLRDFKIVEKILKRI